MTNFIYDYYCSVLEQDFQDPEPKLDYCPLCFYTQMEPHIPSRIPLFNKSAYSKASDMENDHKTSQQKFYDSNQEIVKEAEKKKDLNPFRQDDKVRSKDKRHGVVIHILCNKCEPCKDKKYVNCIAKNEEKTHVLVSFPKNDGTNTRKRSKFEFGELWFEEPLPLKKEKICDLSPKSIRLLANATVVIPIMYLMEDEHEEDTETAGKSEQEEDVEFLDDDERAFLAEYDEEEAVMIDSDIMQSPL